MVMMATITEDTRKRVLCLLSRQGRRDDIEDALQEACLRYYISALLFSDEQALTAWLYCVARNIICDISRFRLKHPTCALEEVNYALFPSEDVAIDRIVFYAVIGSLNKEEQTLVMLRGQGYTNAQIAQRTDFSAEATKKRVQRLRLRLNTLISY